MANIADLKRLNFITETAPNESLAELSLDQLKDLGYITQVISNEDIESALSAGTESDSSEPTPDPDEPTPEPGE